MKRFVLFIVAAALPLFAEPADIRDTLAARFNNGICVQFTTKVVPGGKQISSGTLITLQNLVRRVISDERGGLRFAYDMEAGRSGSNFTLRVLPVAAAFQEDVRSGKWSLDGNSQGRLPTFAMPREIGGIGAGDSVELELLSNPKTGEKVIDVVHLTVEPLTGETGSMLAQSQPEMALEIERVWDAIQRTDFRSAYQHNRAVMAGALDAIHRAGTPGNWRAERLAYPTNPADTTYLLGMVAATKQAIVAGNYRRVCDYSVSLSNAIHNEIERRRPTPAQLAGQRRNQSAQKLERLEQEAGGQTGVRRFLQLPELAKTAYAAGDMNKAAAYANELLTAIPAQRPIVRLGQAIFDGNVIAGRVALQAGNVFSAREHLLAAGKTPGSPALQTYGPSMALAKELLEKGEKDIVLEYLAECKGFWKMDRGRLDGWIAKIKDGKLPDFGANLLY